MFPDACNRISAAGTPPKARVDLANNGIPFCNASADASPVGPRLNEISKIAAALADAVTVTRVR